MASGDRLQIADKPTLDEINTTIGDTGDTGGSTVAGTVMSKLNTLIDQDDVQSNKLDTVLTILGSGVAEYTSPGTYQLEIPAGITKIKVTACGGGGGGGGTMLYGNREGIYPSNCYIPAGGSGGQAIVDQEYTLDNTGTATTLNITVGRGGAGATGANSSNVNGENGTATIIGNLVTLQGGNGGTATRIDPTSSSVYSGGTSQSAGQGSGAGSSGKMVCSGYNTDTNYTFTVDGGSDGANPNTGGNPGSGQMQGHTYYALIIGGAGGGSLGKGGNAGRSSENSSSSETAGQRGGGGSGAVGKFYYGSILGREAAGKQGGNGYVKIEWGL